MLLAEVLLRLLARQGQGRKGGHHHRKSSAASPAASPSLAHARRPSSMTGLPAAGSLNNSNSQQRPRGRRQGWRQWARRWWRRLMGDEKEEEQEAGGRLVWVVLDLLLVLCSAVYVVAEVSHQTAAHGCVHRPSRSRDGLSQTP